MIATEAMVQDHPSILKSTIVKRAAEESKLEENPFAGEDLRRIDYLPTPEDIASACASIRSGWTLSEKRRRFVGELMPDEPDSLWRPPVIDTALFRNISSRNSLESSL